MKNVLIRFRSIGFQPFTKMLGNQLLTIVRESRGSGIGRLFGDSCLIRTGATHCGLEQRSIIITHHCRLFFIFLLSLSLSFERLFLSLSAVCLWSGIEKRECSDYCVSLLFLSFFFPTIISLLSPVANCDGCYYTRARAARERCSACACVQLFSKEEKGRNRDSTKRFSSLRRLVLLSFLVRYDDRHKGELFLDEEEEEEEERKATKLIRFLFPIVLFCSFHHPRCYVFKRRIIHLRHGTRR